jgi:hypothetical protein
MLPSRLFGKIPILIVLAAVWSRRGGCIVVFKDECAQTMAGGATRSSSDDYD